MKRMRNRKKDRAWKDFFKSNVKHKVVIGGDADWIFEALGWKKGGKQK